MVIIIVKIIMMSVLMMAMSVSSIEGMPEMMMMMYVRINFDEFISKIAQGMKMNLNMCNWSLLH